MAKKEILISGYRVVPPVMGGREFDPIPPQPPAGVPLSFFNLGAWDFSQVAGVEGDTVTTGIASLAGSGVQTLTPANAPSLDDAAIGGRRALSFDGVGAQNYLRCDALAPYFTFGQALTVVARYRGARAADLPLFAAGKSSSAIDTFFKCVQTSLSKTRIDTNTIAAGTVQRTGTVDLQYDEHILVVTISPAGVIKSYADNVLDTLSSSTMDPNALTCDRFAVAGILSTAIASSLTGYVQWFGMSTTEATAAQVAQINAQLRATDFVLPKASSKQVCWVGDSITETGVGTLLVAGIRGYELQNVLDCGLSLNHVGNRVAGTIADRECVAQGGADIATISANFTAAMTADPTMAPDLIIVMAGTNNIATAPALAGFRAAYDALLNNLYSTTVARNPGVKIAVSKITPIQPGLSPADVNWVTANGYLTTPSTGAWAVFEAAHPGVLVYCDNAAALGNAWSSTDYGADTTHPNEVGSQKIGAAQMLVYGALLRTLSTTVKPLTCTIKVPAASASIAYGTPFTISGRVSRYPSTVVVKKGATVLGSATMNKKAWTYSGTLLVGDLGTVTLNATVTDTSDSTTANAAGVVVTVVAPAYSPADEGNAILRLDASDPTGITQGAGVCTAIKNLISGVSATPAANAPAYSATAGPGGNTPAITAIAASTQDLVSATDTTVGAGMSGDDHSFSWAGVVKFTSTSANGVLFSVGASGGVASQFIGQITTGGAIRVYRNPDANVSQVNWQVTAVPAGWMLLEVAFDGVAKTLTVRVNGGAPSTVGSYDTTALTVNRWALFREAWSPGGSYCSGSISEIWKFSDFQIGKAPSGGKDAADRVYNYLVAKHPGLGLSPR